MMNSHGYSPMFTGLMKTQKGKVFWKSFVMLTSVPTCCGARLATSILSDFLKRKEDNVKA